MRDIFNRRSLNRGMANLTAAVHFLMFCVMPQNVHAQISAQDYVPQGGVSSAVLPDFDSLTNNIPDVTQSGNGTDVINITDPVNGVSINAFEQFTVGQDGVILNNSLAPGVSFIGGFVGANANLTTPADLILNQVTSNELSLVQGAIEVFGAAADVIIANPNGITVNGAEFINTNAASFVTGLVSVQNNEVIFDVSGGAIVVQRGGVSGARDLTLAARNIGLDGEVRAQDGLVISGGAHNVFPDKPVTEKPAETRMGSGKGNPERWVAVVKPGKVMFELSFHDEEVARAAIDRAIQKMPIKCKFVKREEGF